MVLRTSLHVRAASSRRGVSSLLVFGAALGAFACGSQEPSGPVSDVAGPTVAAVPNSPSSVQAPVPAARPVPAATPEPVPLTVQPGGSLEMNFGFLADVATVERAQDAYEFWKERYLIECPNDVYRVAFDLPSQTVSEGIAYGMLLSAYHEDQAVFDGLWQYYINASNDDGIMHWKRAGCEATNEQGAGENWNNGASDAELDAAMALIKASCTWPNNGRHDYAAAATNLIEQIERFETVRIGEFGRMLRPGSAFGGLSCLNYSYFAPGYYRTFADYVPERADFWNEMAVDAYSLIARGTHPETGLVPNWAHADGTTAVSCDWFTNHEAYGWDAVRTPWRVALDYLWHGTPEAKAFIDKITGWVDSDLGGLPELRSQHRLDGSQLVGSRSAAATGGMAVAGMVLSKEKADEYLGHFANTEVTGYFSTTLNALYWLSASGKFTHDCSAVSYP